MNKAFIISIILISFFSFVSASSVTLIKPNGGENISGNYDVNFLVNSLSNDISAQIYYDNDNNSADGNTLVASGIALNASNCGDADFSTPNFCIYSLNSSTIPNGSYYLYVVIVLNSNPSIPWITDYSDNSFTINNSFDTTPPTTTSDANTLAQNFAANVSLACNDGTGSGCNKTQWRLNNGPWFDYNGTKINISAEATHTLDFNSTDNAGNMEAMKTATIIIDSTAPSTGSPSLPTYTNSSTPTFSFNASGATKVKLSCNNSDYSSSFTYSASFSSFNITNGANGCNSNNESKTINAMFGDDAGNWSSTASASTYYDTSNPQTPDGLTATINGSSEIRLAWNSASDSGSGLQKYEARLDSGSWNDAGTSTSYTFNNVSSGTYNVYVRAVDRAGNTSNETSKSISISNSCSLSITINAPSYAKPNQQITIEVTSSADMTNADLIVDSESQTKTLRDNYNGRSFSEAHTFRTSDEGIATIKLNATDSNGRTCDKSVDVTIDSKIPVITSFDSPKADAQLSEKVGIIVRARDDQSGVQKVDIYYRKVGELNWIKITTINSSIGNLWSFPWTFKTLTAGDYEIRTRAVDFAGNENEAIIAVKLATGVSTPIPEDNGNTNTQLAQLIETNNSLKKGIQDLMNFLKLVHISLSEKISSDWSKANSKLLQANNSDDENAAILAAKEAKSLYTGLASMIQTSTETTADYSFNAEELEAMLKAQGINDAQLLEQAKNYSQLVSVKRTLEIKKVVVDGKTYYTAAIVLTLKNNDNAEKSFKLVEVVPKQFAQNALNLSSEQEFTTITADPIIAFNAVVASEAEKEFEYYLSDPITKEQADAMIANNTIQSFNSPAILFNADQELSSASFGQKSSTPTGLFSGLNIDFNGLLKPIGILVGLIIVIALVGFTLRNRGSYSSNDYPLAAPKFSGRLKRHEDPTLEFREKPKNNGKWGTG